MKNLKFLTLIVIVSTALCFTSCTDQTEELVIETASKEHMLINPKNGGKPDKIEEWDWDGEE